MNSALFNSIIGPPSIRNAVYGCMYPYTSLRCWSSDITGGKVKQDKRDARQRQIETAAYELLEEKGYLATSMLSIAKQAKASNETLYRWYGDKKGLFSSLIRRNLEDVESVFEHTTKDHIPPLQTLQELGPRLLELLVGPRAIALNRAAAADATGELGRVLAKGGRQRVLPMISEVFERLVLEGKAEVTSHEAAELYIGLLVGDAQIRRVTGAVGEMDQTQIKARSDRAYYAILKILEIVW